MNQQSNSDSDSEQYMEAIIDDLFAAMDKPSTLPSTLSLHLSLDEHPNTSSSSSSPSSSNPPPTKYDMAQRGDSQTFNRLNRSQEEEEEEPRSLFAPLPDNDDDDEEVKIIQRPNKATVACKDGAYHSPPAAPSSSSSVVTQSSNKKRPKSPGFMPKGWDPHQLSPTQQYKYAKQHPDFEFKKPSWWHLVHRPYRNTTYYAAAAASSSSSSSSSSSPATASTPLEEVVWNHRTPVEYNFNHMSPARFTEAAFDKLPRNEWYWSFKYDGHAALWDGYKGLLYSKGTGGRTMCVKPPQGWNLPRDVLLVVELCLPLVGKDFPHTNQATDLAGVTAVWKLDNLHLANDTKSQRKRLASELWYPVTGLRAAVIDWVGGPDESRDITDNKGIMRHQTKRGVLSLTAAQRYHILKTKVQYDAQYCFLVEQNECPPPYQFLPSSLLMGSSSSGVTDSVMLDRFRDQCEKLGAEGVVFKQKPSLYETSGARYNTKWLKWKKREAIHLLYIQRVHGLNAGASMTGTIRVRTPGSNAEQLVGGFRRDELFALPAPNPDKPRIIEVTYLLRPDSSSSSSSSSNGNPYDPRIREPVFLRVLPEGVSWEEIRKAYVEGDSPPHIDA